MLTPQALPFRLRRRPPALVRVSVQPVGWWASFHRGEREVLAWAQHRHKDGSDLVADLVDHHGGLRRADRLRGFSGYRSLRGDDVQREAPPLPPSSLRALLLEAAGGAGSAEDLHGRLLRGLGEVAGRALLSALLELERGAPRARTVAEVFPAQGLTEVDWLVSIGLGWPPSESGASSDSRELER